MLLFYSKSSNRSSVFRSAPNIFTQTFSATSSSKWSASKRRTERSDAFRQRWGGGFCLFSLFKLARRGSGLLLLLGRSFGLRLLYRQKQNQCVGLSTEEYLKKKRHKTKIIYGLNFYWRCAKAAKNSSLVVCSWPLLDLLVPSVWRRDSRWRWRRSPVGPACSPVGSSGSSCSRFESCPRCTQNQTVISLLTLAPTQSRFCAKQHCHLMVTGYMTGCFTWTAFRYTWTGWDRPRRARPTSAPEWSSPPRPAPGTNPWLPCTASPRARGVSARPCTGEKQIKTSFNLLAIKNAARIYIRSGRCCPGFPQWSRAVGSGQSHVWGRFPWWCRSSRSRAECKGRWTKATTKKGGENIATRMQDWKPWKRLLRAVLEADTVHGGEPLPARWWGRCPAAHGPSGILEWEVSFRKTTSSIFKMKWFHRHLQYSSQTGLDIMTNNQSFWSRRDKSCIAGTCNYIILV